MSDDANLYLLLMAEKLMIVHLSRDKGIGTGCHGITEHESARTAAKCPLSDTPATVPAPSTVSVPSSALK